MRRYTIAWTGFAVLVAFAQATAAQEGATALWDNVVCMSLPMYVMSLLLPAEDIVTALGRKVGLREQSSQEKETERIEAGE